MAKKVKGYVELFWTCPNCGTENRGGDKVCAGCGAPQPENVEFHQGARSELITDEERLKKAKAGADIHCAFCGTRNPATATHCSQCKAELSEGTKRKTGRVVGKFKSGPAGTIACPNCGAENPDTALKCSGCGASLAPEAQREERPAAARPGKKSKAPIFIIGAVLLAACAAIYFIFFNTKEVTGEVVSVNWECTTQIMGYGDVEKEDWYDNIPIDAEILSCSEKERRVSDSYVEGSVEECEEAEVIDEGTGYAKVVEECTYHVYEDYCTYASVEWTVIDTATLTGDDYDFECPNPVLGVDEELGESEETYTIVFEVDGKTYSYDADYDEYMDADIGSTWTLEMNALGITSINP